MTARETLHLIVVKPTRYDHDSFAIRWARSTVPSISDAVRHSLIDDCGPRNVLGEDVTSKTI